MKIRVNDREMMPNQPEFVTGKELSRHLAAEIAPNLRTLFPSVPLGLALIGPGSDVLGYDTARSMDHDWGPRLTIVVPEAVRIEVAHRIEANVDLVLPSTIGGFPTRFSFHPDGTMHSDPRGKAHRLQVTSVQQILQTNLLIDSVDDLHDAVWLSTPMQVLLELIGGEVFADDEGELTRLRDVLDFYPENVWRYQLAGLWMRIGQVQPFIGRTAEVGDNAGSAAIAANIIRDLMRITLLQSRVYAPYAKWLGTAFSRTTIGKEILPEFVKAFGAADWRLREQGINVAGSKVVDQLNALDLINPVANGAFQFHSRPFQVLAAEEIAMALRESVMDTQRLNLEATTGGIDCVTDSTDALGSHEFRKAFRNMIELSLR